MMRTKSRAGYALLALTTLLFNQPSGSQPDENTRYVIDRVVITVRSEPSPEADVIERLSTGDAMHSLGEEKSPYTKIALPDGRVGWVEGAYISETPVASSEEARQLADDNLDLTRQLGESLTALAQAEASIIELSEDYERANLELARLRKATTQPSELEAQITQLKQKLASAGEALDQVNRANKELAEGKTWRWFLIGAGVLAAGAILGYLISLFGRRRSPFY